jgi:hypothetical protein
MRTRPVLLSLALTVSLAASARGAEAPAAFGPQPRPVATAPGPEARLGLSFGVDGGLGAEGDLTVDRLASGLPVALRLGLAYRALDPGRPLDARHVFINENSNGSPEESGHRWELRLDAVGRPWRGRNLWLAAGPRWSAFTAQFDFVDGNEFFSVSTRQWGFGASLGSRYAMSPRVDLVLDAGLDYYAAAALAGHDTSYNPDGSAVNPHQAYTYADADAAIAQPRWAPRFSLGVDVRLGR